MRIRDIFKSSSKISGANIAGGVLSVVANIQVARKLGPEALGIVGLIQLWLLYAGFSRPGLIQAACREIPHFAAQSQEERALRAQNVALTTEFALLAVPILVMLAASLFYSDHRLRVGMMIAAATFLTNSLYQFTDSVQWARQRYSLITRVNLVIKLVQPLLILAGVYTLGLYGVLAAPAVASLIAFLCYLASRALADFRPAWDAREAKRLFKIGIALSLYTFLYWGFRTSDRAMVASWLSIKELGYFTLAMSFIAQGCQLISDFLSVLQPNLFAELGKAGAVRPLAGKIQRVSLLTLLLTGAAASAAESFFRPVVAVLLPKFLPAAPVFEVLTLNLVCTTAPLLAYVVLVSAVVDSQKQVSLIQLGGLAINVAAGWLLIKLGFGLSGIAWSSALSQITVAVLAYALLHRRLFDGAPAGEALSFYGAAAALCGISLGLHLIMDRGPFAFGAGALWERAFLRLSLAGAAWLAAGGWLYLRWWAPLQLPADRVPAWLPSWLRGAGAP